MTDTPTDDEREALADLIAEERDKWPRVANDMDSEELAEAILDAGFRRSEVPEPSAEDAEVTLTTEAVEANREYIERTAEQGEPSEDGREALIEEARAKAAIRFPAADDVDAALARAGFVEGYLTRPEPQGEPSDALVLAAAKAMAVASNDAPWADLFDDLRDSYRSLARAALRAAWGAR